jgi:hypothetical protein
MEENKTTKEKFITWLENKKLAVAVIVIVIITSYFATFLDSISRIKNFFIPSDSPVHITGIDITPYEVDKSVSVNIHFTNTEPLLINQGDLALQYFQIPEGVSWSKERFAFEDKFWLSFEKNGLKDIEKSPILSSPVGQNQTMSIGGVFLSKNQIENLQNGNAVLYYAAIIPYKHGKLELCGYIQAYSGPVFQCAKHNSNI